MWSIASSFFTYHNVFEVYPCFSTYQYFVLFIHSPVDRHQIVSNIWLLSMNNVAMNTCVQCLLLSKVNIRSRVAGYNRQSNGQKMFKSNPWELCIVIIQGRGYFADVTNNLNMGEYPGLSRWAQFKRKGPYNSDAGDLQSK